MDDSTWEHYQRLCKAMEFLDCNDPRDADEFGRLRDELCSLPGFPMEALKDPRAYIRPVAKQPVIYSSPRQILEREEHAFDGRVLDFRGKVVH